MASHSEGVLFSKSVVMTLKQPGPNPVFSARYARLRVVNGVSGDGLTIMGQPAANDARDFLNAIAIGRFQGQGTTTTPRGTFTVKTLLSGADAI